jgi:hypothetical protein
MGKADGSSEKKNAGRLSRLSRCLLSTPENQRDSPQGLVTGEPRETETLMRGSEAGRQKSAPQSNSLAA